MIMKVEAVVLKPMRAGDGKQGIKFAWPNLNQLWVVGQSKIKQKGNF